MISKKENELQLFERAPFSSSGHKLIKCKFRLHDGASLSIDVPTGYSSIGQNWGAGALYYRESDKGVEIYPDDYCFVRRDNKTAPNDKAYLLEQGITLDILNFLRTAEPLPAHSSVISRTLEHFDHVRDRARESFVEAERLAQEAKLPPRPMPRTSDAAAGTEHPTAG